MLLIGDICLEKDFLLEKYNLNKYCLYRYRMSFSFILILDFFIIHYLFGSSLPSRKKYICSCYFIYQNIYQRPTQFTKTSHITSNHFSDNWDTLKATRINNVLIKRILRHFISRFLFYFVFYKPFIFCEVCKDK